MLDQGYAVAATEDLESGTSSLHALEQRWSNITPILKRELGDAAFKSWIAPLSAKSCATGVLTLTAPSRFVRDWIKTHYTERMRQLWTQQGEALVRIDVEIDATVKAPAMQEVPAPANVNETADEDTVSSALDPRFTFDNFVVGKPNELAHAAAKRVAESDAPGFNPLFIHGGVGLGKTHLMHAIAWAIRVRAPERKVVYLSAEKFMYRFVRSLRFKDTMTFKEQFRSVDILMVDDIQFICGKGATQEEFFHTFNALVEQGKQVVVAADHPPSDMDGLEERLRSRLNWGLVANIHPATYELRLGILEQKREMLGREIPQDVLELLAERIASNVRELEGALNRLIVHAELSKRAITLETAQDLLQDLLRAHDRRVSVEEIQKKVAEHYHIRLSDMHSPRRARALARPRQIAMYLAKVMTQHSLPEIGRKFGGRDHTTIMHGVRRIEELMAADSLLAQDVGLLHRALEA